MAYLTFEEFEEMNSDTEIKKDEFNKLIGKASSILDTITNDFYQFNDLENDIEYRSKRFKQAVAAQIVFFNESGLTSQYKLNNKVQSFSAGRTNVSMGGSKQSTNSTKETSIIADEVYLYLRGTGLLYRGVQ